MRKRIGILCVLLILGLLIPQVCLAQLELELASECIAAEGVLDFSVSGDEAVQYRYTMFRDGKELFTSETEMPFGSYLPREPGGYRLQVTALRQNGDETVQADFTVTEKMTCSLQVQSHSLRAGEPLLTEVHAEGGTGKYRYVYTVWLEDENLLQQEGEASWHWVPEKEGTYTLQVLVMDDQGAAVTAEMEFEAAPGPGISLQASGGDLGSQGGQKSWNVYAAAPWEAHTNADFLTLETSSGRSGDPLTVTVATETSEYREGTIVLTSGNRKLEWTVAQSAGHGIDEEISLFASETSLDVEGREHAVWLNAQGSRTFTVNASEEWSAAVNEDFVQMVRGEDELTLLVEESQQTAVRSAIVTLECGNRFAYIHVYQLPARPVQLEKEANALPEREPSIALYSQFSGLWKEKRYGSSTLEHSGCAIFALSHALEHLGYEGDSILPEALAKKYAFCLRDGGTINSTLIGNAGDDFGFKTRYELIESLSTIRSRMEEGAVYSFAVVSGHIAMIVEQNEDGSMFRVMDSAPSATWERIQNAQLYRRTEEGSYVPIQSLTELEGIRYYIENQAFGGATYWLTDEYVARRGVRLIQPKKEE